MPKADYFSIESISQSAWKIYENWQASMYLVCGSERACLIDTGYGGGDLPAVVRSLTDLPTVVVNTHGHIDHVLGNRFFPTVLMHSADHDLYRRVVAGFPQYISQPWVRTSFGDIIDTIDLAAVRFAEAKTIAEGDVIDLGGKRLEIFSMPGHTAGSIILIDRDDKIVYAGDSIMEKLWLFLNNGATAEAYL
ncbi:MAG: MBL fold metallo-hydrolase, partial [Ruminococcaceae bacterium]|nr:MBL fold metallo-hydrolase [Oscillospiraceae bacterium]